MKAVRISGYNQAPSLEDVDVPEPGPGEVLVRVRAASLNPLDVKLYLGYMQSFFPLTFPYTLGTDVAGVVEKTGSLVSHWRAGDRVVVESQPTKGGALAEFAVVDSSNLVRLPDSVSFTDAAGLPIAAGTAWQALFDIANLSKGQTVLIHAGAGGVGSFAVQFARQAGARVIATASGAGLEIVRKLGADQVIDYRTQDFESMVSDVDVVLDTIGGETQQKSYGVLRTGGALLATSAPPDEALAKAHKVSGSFVFHQPDATLLSKVVRKVEDGSTKVLVDSYHELSDFKAAFDHQGSGRAKGKIILSIAS
ncbi:NADP-dependent oxidoreductase [Agrobacterium salinitolerans]|uniref:NADP-dependent oxidoreductase n=1 Tax=Agrobacterium salinitolerans TaxID=1183413 RepID=UPI0015719C46|nr:NADP-dependent oxidoreductase [Agrobacterium salinitolerans]NTA40269.1 NADP-dependent oxidoreductase [Agrobacterium salinitolerans]